ncbi:MAG: right-handed parallel beta-helix repeat-containing protein [Kofleriaceae bacterium]
MRAARAALLVLVVAGCELIADIPNSTPAADDGGTNRDGTGDPDAPIDAMRGCALDSECASGVCLTDGSCADGARILFAAPTGTGTTCELAAPCTFDTAVTKLTATTDIIKLAPGVYDRMTQTEIAVSATIAGAGATFHGIPSGNMGLFTAHLNVTAGKLVVIGLDFDLNSTIGISCPSGEVQLARTKMHGGYYGLYGSNTCVVGIDRASFYGNLWYGAYFATGATVTITNSYFTDNNAGNTIASLSALVFFDNVTATIAHSTFANNRGDVASVQCTNSSVTMRSIISFGNQSPGVAPTCTDVSYSVLDPGYTGPGSNNVTTNPMFIGNGTYHLSPASPVRGMGDPGSTISVDSDGEARPQPAGSRVDPGADEVQ